MAPAIDIDYLLFPKNYSGHAIIAAFGIAQLVGTRWTLRFQGLDHNRLPRDSIVVAEKGKKLSPEQLNYVKRRNAAHYNGLENLPFFVGAVILANLAKLPTSEINYFCGFYVTSRLVYTILYALIADEILATSRTVVWWAGMISALRMLLKAGSKLG